MTIAIPITTDIPSKILKIKNGNVFGSETAFISETIQNSYRASAKNLFFTLSEYCINIYDDGIGCLDPSHITTFDLSSWISTDEGFGMGIWSILAIPGLERINIKSYTWSLDIDVQSLGTTPSATLTEHPYIKGFSITLYGEFSQDRLYTELWNAINETGKYQPFNIYINSTQIEQTSVYDSLPPTFSKDFDTPFFTAKFNIPESGTYHPRSKIFYEKRLVCEHYISNTAAIIELKPGALNLREPDRTQITHNDKYYEFDRCCDRCVSHLYSDFIKSATIDDFDKYENYISNTLSAEEYLSKLTFCLNDIITTKTPNFTNPNSPPERTTDTDREHSHPLGNKPISASPTANHNPTSTKNHTTLKSALKKHKMMVWVRSKELHEHADLISLAQYYRIPVYIARNSLFDQAFRHLDIIHISDMTDHIIKTSSTSRSHPITKKEEIFISQILRKITRHFQIPDSTFVICDLKTSLTFQYNETKSRPIIIPTLACTDGMTIFLNRKSLNLKQFTLKENNFGIHELKSVIAVSTTLAHELAHLLYSTKDNTLDHYIYQTEIQTRINRLLSNH